MKPIHISTSLATLNGQKIFTGLALLLVLCITEVPGLAVAATGGLASSSVTTIEPGKLIVGRLHVDYDQKILVNALEAHSGDTVISGSRVQTQFLPATIEIVSIGEIHVAPNTNLVVKFDSKHIQATISVGEATISARDGVESKVTMPQGTTQSTAPQITNTTGNLWTNVTGPLIVTSWVTFVIVIRFVIYDENGKELCRGVVSAVVRCEVIP